MTQRKNEHDQPIGHQLTDWGGARHPGHTAMAGRYCRVEPLDAERHAQDLFDAYGQEPADAIWTYHVIGPFDTADALKAWAERASGNDDQPYFAIVDQSTGSAVGIASYMRIKQGHGVIEVGGIAYSAVLQRTRAASEAMYLMMQRVFDDLGYRRYEWKCDALNAPSRSAALRLGFTYDGLFEQAVVYKGRNRDTAWYSILDRDWPATRRAYQNWLDPDNFDAAGHQKQRLADLIAAERDPQ